MEYSFKKVIISKSLCFITIVFFALLLKTANAQTVLNATSGTNAYTVINGVLAPGYTAVEAPDQTTGTYPGNHASFGRHIAMVQDNTVPLTSSNPNRYVFEFYSHANPFVDNDISTGDADRERVEIKTYDPSPASLKGVNGDVMTYTWYFKLPTGFQPSPTFTHIHQIKAVGGDASDPIFTITPSYSSGGNTLNIRYVKDSTQGNSSNPYTLLATSPLSSFLGQWVKVTEVIQVSTSAANGAYSIKIEAANTDGSLGATLLSYATTNIQTIRPSNSFIRPKWGIYRSIANVSYLRDEAVRFATISINKGNTYAAPAAPSNLIATPTSNTIALAWTNNSGGNEFGFNIQRSLNGTTWSNLKNLPAGTTTYTDAGLLPSTTYYYQVNAANPAGASAYCTSVSVSTVSQTTGATYYWKGGLTGDWTTGSNWKTKAGVSRSNNTSDILIFDGSNIDGANTALTSGQQIVPIGIAGSSSQSFGALIVQNGANVAIGRYTGTASGTMSLNGEGTSMDDLQVDATSTLQISNQISGPSIFFVMGVNATGNIKGTVKIYDGGLGKASITAGVAGSLIFGSGSHCYVKNTFSSSYPFSPSSSSSTINYGIIFQSGSTLHYQGGNSPFTGSSSITPFSFETNSNLIFEGNSAFTIDNVFNKHILSNVVVGDGTNTISIPSDGSPSNIDNLTINTNATLTLASTGTFPVSGNITNNGTLNCASGYTSSHLILIGSVPQTVSGNTFTVGAFSVGSDASVTLNTNITIGNYAATTPSTSTISGKLNVKGNIISSAGTTQPGIFRLKSGATTTTSSAATIAKTSNTITLTVGTYAAANVSLGALVLGAGIPDNSYIVATSSSNYQFSISKLPTENFSSNTGTITIVSNSGTLQTSNANGVDGSITSTGTKSFESTANYIFDAATTTPFSTSTTSAGNVTFNGNATLNLAALSLSGDLKVSNGTLTTGSNSLTLAAGKGTALFAPGTNLSIDGGTVNFNNQPVVFQSSAAGTASIGNISGTLSNANNVTVQQYIPAGFRAFRLFSHPFKTTKSLNQLMNAIDITGNPNGTINVTGQTTGTGFTPTLTNNPSAFYFDPTTTDGSINDAGWKAFTDTTLANSSWNVGKAIKLLVRGSQGQNGTLDGTNASPIETILSQTGSINTGNLSISLVGPGSNSASTAGFNLVGNPYPSAVDIGAVLTASSSSVTGNSFYLRNPQTNSYYTISPIPSSYIIPANTGFFVQTTGSTPTLNFTEANKSNTSNSSITVFGESNQNFIQLKAIQNGLQYDNLYVYLGDSYKANYDKKTDAVKLMNDGLSMYTISTDKEKLAADYRSSYETKSIPLGIYLPKVYGKQSYTIYVSDNKLISGFTTLYLHDKLKNTFMELSEGASYILEINPADTATLGENRLEITSSKNLSANSASEQTIDKFKVTIAGNPVNDKIIVNYAASYAGLTTINLINSFGQKVSNLNLGNRQFGQAIIPMTSFSKGMYVVEVKIGNDIVHKKVLKN